MAASHLLWCETYGRNPSEALGFDVTTTPTRAEWVEVLFTHTDVVLRAACALELEFEGKHGSGVGAKCVAPSTLP